MAYFLPLLLPPPTHKKMGHGLNTYKKRKNNLYYNIVQV